MMVEGCLDTLVALAAAIMIFSRSVSVESKLDTESGATRLGLFIMSGGYESHLTTQSEQES